MRTPSSPRPEAWASRWATVDPSGPAGSSRRRVSSSTPPSTAMAVSTLLTEARGSGSSRGLVAALVRSAGLARPVVGGGPAGAAGPVVTVDSPQVGEPGVSNELVFTVSRTAGPAATGDYQTAGGSATAGADYLATSGTLAF